MGKKVLLIVLMLFLVGCNNVNEMNKAEVENKTEVMDKVVEKNLENKTEVTDKVVEKKLEDKLDDILKDQKEREYHVYIENLNSGETYIWGDENYKRSALGTVFIPIMIAADNELGWVSEFGGDSEVTHKIADMIRYSDSSAANRLIDLLGGKEKGLDRINDLLKEIGCINTEVNRYLGDTTSVKDNYTSSYDMAVMMKYIYDKDQGNNKMVGTLRSAAEGSDGIKKSIHNQNGFISASEYGSAASGYRGKQESVYNNAGIVISDDSKNSYIISIISSGNDSLNDAMDTVRELIGTLIHRNIEAEGEQIIFQDKELEAFIRKEVNKPVELIYESDVELIARQLSFKKFNFPQKVKNIIERYKNDCAKKNIVIFEDENLEEAIRYEINNFSGDILKSQVEKITELQEDNKNIKSISGLENLTNLTRLFLTENQISNVEPLRGLTKLTHLSIDINNITSIEPLSGLINLDTLYIDKNSIDDFTPVKNYIKNLEGFAYDVVNRSLLGENKSRQVISEAASNLIHSKLHYYEIVSSWSVDTVTDIVDYQIPEKADLQGIEIFKNLTYINLRAYGFTNLKPLGELHNLRQVILHDTGTESIAGLKDLTNLEYLDLRGNPITDWEVLREFKSSPVIVADISPVYQKYIDEYNEKLNINHEDDGDIIVFKDKKLEEVIRTQINKLEGDLLKGDVKYIFDLRAEGLSIKNLSGIENLENLSHLYLNNNDITDIEPLKGLTGLVKLEMNYNNIENIDALENITGLISLELKANRISGIEAIRNMKKLVRLQLEFNEVKDYELLEEYAERIGEIYYDKVYRGLWN